MFGEINKKELLCLFVILTLASLFRLWQLDSIPPGLYPDSAIYANDGWQTLKTKDFKVFYPENNGREGLYVWLLAFSFWIFGPSVWSLRVVGAVTGILTVFGLYLLTKELFNQQTSKLKNQPINPSTIVALISAFFLAISFWHTNFSRIGFRAILVPFILVFAFYFLFKGFRIRKAFYLIASGIIFGLGFYTYISYRFVIFLIPLILIIYYFIYRRQNLQKEFLILSLSLLISIFIVGLPIGIYFLQHPQDFITRAAGVSIFSQENPILSFFISLVRHLLMFNILGDLNWRHNIPGEPIFLRSAGILFLMGLFYSLYKIWVDWKKKNYNSALIYLFIISWWFVMLMPGILTAEGTPHFLRCIGSIPPTFIFPALGLSFLIETIQETKEKRKSFFFYLLGLSFLIYLSVLVSAQYFQYFEKWARSPETKNAFSANLVDIGDYLNSLPESIKKYVIVNQSGVPVPYPGGIPMPAQTPMFIEITKFGRVRTEYLLPNDLNKITTQEKAVIILMDYDGNLISELYNRFPEGTFMGINDVWVFQTKVQ